MGNCGGPKPVLLFLGESGDIKTGPKGASSMTLTIDLQPEIESSLIAQAKARGVSLSDHAREILARASAVTIPETREATSKAPEARNLYELFAPVRGLLTDRFLFQPHPLGKHWRTGGGRALTSGFRNC